MLPIAWESLVVLRVDTEKKYIDLTRKQIAESDIEDCLIRFNRAKQADNIFRKTALHLSEPLSSVYNNIAYPLQTLFPDAMAGLEHMARYPADWCNIESANSKIVLFLIEELPERFRNVPQKYCRVLDITCFSIGGIDKIKEAFKAVINRIPFITVNISQRRIMKCR